MAENQKDQVFSTVQAAERVGVSVHYMRGLLRDGKIVARKDRGAFVIAESDLQAWNSARSGNGTKSFELLVATDGKQASLREAAELADVSTVYMRNLVINGKVRGWKEDGNWIVDAQSARDFEKSRTAADGILYVLQLNEEQVQQLTELGFELERKNKPSTK